MGQRKHQPIRQGKIWQVSREQNFAEDELAALVVLVRKFKDRAIDAQVQHEFFFSTTL